MNIRLFEVKQRRNEILARIAAQREALAEVEISLQKPLTYVDQGLGAVRFLRAHLALTTALAALIGIRRRGVFGLGKLVWRGWRLFRLAKSFAANPPSRP